MQELIALTVLEILLFLIAWVLVLTTERVIVRFIKNLQNKNIRR